MPRIGENGSDKRLAFIGLSLMAAFLLSGIPALAQSGKQQSQQGLELTPKVYVVTVEGVIDPFTAQYVERGLDMARRDSAQCLIIQLDTPGGSDIAMRVIVQRMLNSSVPLVVYVAPSGARAGSAGVFITMAAHVAAMSPGTNIGAAHPVAMPGTEMTEVIEQKVTSDAAAYVRAIAEERGRNANWAEKAVRESASIVAREALEYEVADIIANDLTDLLGQLDGREVMTTGGPVTLSTRDATVRHVDMNLAESILHVIVDPNMTRLHNPL